MSNASLTVFLLAALRELGATGATEDRLLRDARAEGFKDLSAPELLTLLRSLADQSWVTPYAPPIGAKRWRITALGESALTEQGV